MSRLLCIGRLVSKAMSCAPMHTHILVTHSGSNQDPLRMILALNHRWTQMFFTAVVISQFFIHFLGVLVMEQMFVTHLLVIIEHQILSLVTNMRCHEFSILEDWSPKQCHVHQCTHIYWLHIVVQTKILSGGFELWITGGPRCFSLHLWSHNVWSTF